MNAPAGTICAGRDPAEQDSVMMTAQEFSGPARGSIVNFKNTRREVSSEICQPLKEGIMNIIRREFLGLSGIVVTVPSIASIALAQAQAGPKLTQILRKDLESQGQVVQETVVSIVEFPPGAAAPWHMHPGAQE